MKRWEWILVGIGVVWTIDFLWVIGFYGCTRPVPTRCDEGVGSVCMRVAPDGTCSAWISCDALRRRGRVEP